MDEHENIFKNIPELPVCLKQAKFIIPEKFIYGVSVYSLKTKKHRLITYYKPISKLF
jgi:hypothetical protein